MKFDSGSYDEYDIPLAVQGVCLPVRGSILYVEECSSIYMYGQVYMYIAYVFPML